MKKQLLMALIMGVVIVQPSIGLSPEKPNAKFAFKQGILTAVNAAAVPENELNYETYTVWVTAYSSTPEQTDSTPLITASNKQVRDGVIAANFLAFGTKVKIPEIFGDRIFTVEDRMHQRKTNFVDVWMPDKDQAQKFGITRTEILVLN